MRFRITLAVALILCLAGFGSARAQYWRKPQSDLDPRLMQIDEKTVLGAKMDADTPLVGADGKVFPLGSMLGQPLILLLSYYTCDGSCSIINNQLAELLPGVTHVHPGTDYRVLTVSFDRHDTLETLGAFREHLTLTKGMEQDWRFATFQNEQDLKTQTARVGFKFFWSPEDRVFLHPGAFLVLSPQGRLVRVLYPGNIEARDVELAVLDAKVDTIRPNEIGNLIYSLCYSYSFKDGRYRMNIPMFVGFGALGFGVSALGGAIVLFKRNRKGESDAQCA
jgi:protein SCO1/2